MRSLFNCLLITLILSCGKHSSKQALLAHLNQVQFDTLHDWNLGEELLKPISLVKNESEETEMLGRSSPGQKALYIFWHLNAEVTNGGFIQYYWNDERKYVQDLETGLILIGDSVVLDLVKKADGAYQQNKEKFAHQKLKDDWAPLYDSLKVFDSLDKKYYASQQNSMVLFERFIRNHPDQFLKIN
jgi:hypothetical protein